jgi:hypothetical protein
MHISCNIFVIIVLASSSIYQLSVDHFSTPLCSRRTALAFHGLVVIVPKTQSLSIRRLYLVATGTLNSGTQPNVCQSGCKHDDPTRYLQS